MQEPNDRFNVSIRELVEFSLLRGDLSSGFSDSARMVEGTKIHRAIQKTYDKGCESEVYVARSVEAGGITLDIRGRIDGVIKSGGEVVIDEIKSTTADPGGLDEEANPCHWGQAKCYAYLYASENGLDQITVQLTYCNVDSYQIVKFRKIFEISELCEFFNFLVEKFARRALIMCDWRAARDLSIKELAFPFPEYRKGQRDLMVAVYKAVRDAKNIFAQAPTGIGKTMATVFPAIKALGEGHCDKIFYLTAKTITASVAGNAFEKLRKSGLKIRTLTLTAKEKMCPVPGTACNGEECKYACKYYDKLQGAIEDIFAVEELKRDTILSYALKHEVCPFEYSLDLSIISDCVICDYNYAFDPSVYLKRFFVEKNGEYIFLVDESHNLPDRAREMFSAEILKSDFSAGLKEIKAAAPEIKKELSKINSVINAFKKDEMPDGVDYIAKKEAPDELRKTLGRFIKKSRKWLVKNKKSEYAERVMDMFFKAFAFARIADFYDERYVTCYDKNFNDLKIKLFCVDPSFLMSEALKRGKAAVFFSATLSPLSYFIKICGCDENTGAMKLASPFPRENLCTVIEKGVSTKFKDRENTYEEVAQVINCAASCKNGNYLAFFPSYSYMEKVFGIVSSIDTKSKLICQRPGMTEAEKEEFLKEFDEFSDRTMIGFAVMGGIFGEGIDLIGEKLSGAIIVGVGLPQICRERDLIREHFESSAGRGFEFAYAYPGMNRVMQAAGRVIRSENDRGVVVLIDERFVRSPYSLLLPSEWRSLQCERNAAAAEKFIKDFWGGNTRA